MKKETEKFICQVLTFGALITFILTGHDFWAAAMLFILFFGIE